MRRTAAALLTAFLVTVSLSSPLFAGLIDAMVELDRSYVPALALTNQPDKAAGAVAESMRRLDTAWRVFVQGLSRTDRENPALAKAVKDAGTGIKEAGALVDAGKRKDAHEALEGVREGLWTARTAMGIHYLPDLMTAFHGPMEEFFEVAVKADRDPGKMAALLDTLSARWADVEKAKLDPVLFGLSEEKTGRFRMLVQKEREILAQLGTITGTGNSEAISKAAGAMKSTFSQAYLVFGDFTGL